VDEGVRLLSECRVKSSTEGSNPSLSAIVRNLLSVSPFLTRILQLNLPINTLWASGGLKHNTHRDHGIVFKLGPFKTCISLAFVER